MMKKPRLRQVIVVLFLTGFATSVFAKAPSHKSKRAKAQPVEQPEAQPVAQPEAKFVAQPEAQPEFQPEPQPRRSRFWGGAESGRWTNVRALEGFHVKAGVGLRNEKFGWNISGPGGVPDVLSELKWDLKMYEFRGGVAYRLPIGLFFTGDGSYGRNRSDGKYRDSDYLSSGRENEISRSNGKATGSSASSFSLGTGWRFSIQDKFSVSPEAGYSWDWRKVRMKKGVQTVSSSPIVPPVGSVLTGLNAKYNADWHGPWVGVALEAKPIEKLTITSGLRYTWADYKADAYWNLRDLKYTHTSDGHSIKYNLGAAWDITPRDAVGLTFVREDARFSGGKDHTRWSEGAPADLTTGFHRGWSKSWSVLAGYKSAF